MSCVWGLREIFMVWRTAYLISFLGRFLGLPSLAGGWCGRLSQPTPNPSHLGIIFTGKAVIFRICHQAIKGEIDLGLFCGPGFQKVKPMFCWTTVLKIASGKFPESLWVSYRVIPFGISRKASETVFFTIHATGGYCTTANSQDLFPCQPLKTEKFHVDSYTFIYIYKIHRWTVILSEVNTLVMPTRLCGTSANCEAGKVWWDFPGCNRFLQCLE